MKKIDFHVHVQGNLSVESAANGFRDMCQRHGYSGVGIMSLYYKDFLECNDFVLKVKDALKDSYAFAALLPGEDFATQAKRLMSSGFDGIKLIRGGKPNYQRLFGYTYDAPIYEDFFALAEEDQIPILMHSNDPALNWDISRASQRAIDNGWVYDETYPSHEFFYSVIDRVLEKHPKLNIAIAHLGFYSEDIDRAIDLLERYPSLKFDITPALNIYFEMSEYRDKARKFFCDYNDRLIFGTDAENPLIGFSREYNDRKNLITNTFLSGDRESEHVFDGKIIRPIGLDDTVLENVYYNNAIRFVSAYQK